MTQKLYVPSENIPEKILTWHRRLKTHCVRFKLFPNLMSKLKTKLIVWPLGFGADSNDESYTIVKNLVNLYFDCLKVKYWMCRLILIIASIAFWQMYLIKYKNLNSAASNCQCQIRNKKMGFIYGFCSRNGRNMTANWNSILKWNQPTHAYGVNTFILLFILIHLILRTYSVNLYLNLLGSYIILKNLDCIYYIRITEI